MTDYNIQPQEGDCFVSGAQAQALVSRAIKLGQTLRFQPGTAKVATLAQVVVLGLGVWATFTTNGVLGDAAVMLCAFLLSIVAVWVVATVGRQRNAYWANMSHAGVVVRGEGDTLWLCEALAHGLALSPTNKYAPDNIRFIPTSRLMTDKDIQRARLYAHRRVAQHTKYGFVSFFSLFVYCVTAGITFLPTLVIFQSGTIVCSAWAADYLTGPYRFNRETVYVMPANLWADLTNPLSLVW